jgi:hypothetical protein
VVSRPVGRRRNEARPGSRAPEKKAKALDLYERLAREQSGVVSTQVLQEYFVASTRKLGVDPELARRKVQLFGSLGVVVLDRPHILAALYLNADVLTARAQIERMLAGSPVRIDDLDDDAYVLVAATVPRRRA